VARASGCGCGLLAAAGVGLFLGGIFAYTSLVLAGSRFLPGDPSRFDPVASFPAIAAEAGEGAQLVRFEARFVGPEGTLDLTARYQPSPSIEYRFARPAPPPNNAPPLGAGRRLDDQWFVPIEVTASRPWQWYTVSRSSGAGRTAGPLRAGARVPARRVLEARAGAWRAGRRGGDRPLRFLGLPLRDRRNRRRPALRDRLPAAGARALTAQGLRPVPSVRRRTAPAN
jgi:hypothetical protein